MALLSIRYNKMRSILTMLGIIIGVLSVLVLMAVGQGATSQVTDQIKSLGSNILTVTIKSSKTKPFTASELMKLEGTGGIEYISPYLTSSTTSKNGSQTDSDTQIIGAYPSYENIKSDTLDYGRYITDMDIEYSLTNAVIGVDVATNLFGSTDCIGSTITISNKQFTVVGVLTSTGTSSSSNEDERVIIPYTTAQKLFQQSTISSFYVSTTSEDTITEAENTLATFLDSKLGASTSTSSSSSSSTKTSGRSSISSSSTTSNSNYSIFNQNELLETVASASNTLTAMLGGIAGISLLVGGIGIMNIMLVSVSERTKEIGIRKAIGAKRKDILLQFLIESVVISLSGGLIGMVLGYISTIILSSVLSITMSISLNLILLSLGFSIAVGIIFGLYPANAASKLKPIDALRHE